MQVLPNDELFCKERGLVQYVKDNSRFKLVNILNDKEAIAVIQAHIVKVYGG